MTNIKNTKRALISSILALLVCVSMLIGTTFAWFTDSVTSGRNVIQSGNLDVELYYSVLNENGEWTTYAKVTPETDIFGYNNWEPGYTAVAKFKVVNEGSLALKYQLTADVYSEIAGKNVAGDSFKLSDYLLYGVTESLAALDERTTAAAVATNTFGTFNVKSSSLAKNSAAEVGVVITMPETVGNEANHNGVNVPSIEFGINLVATQEMAEDDSFGIDYDANATYPEFINVTKPANEEASVSSESFKVDIPAEAPAGEYTLEISNKNVNTNAAGETTVSFDLSLMQDGVKITTPDGNIKYFVSVIVGENLNVTTVTHKGQEIDYFYDPTEGIVTFETASFSPFEIIYEVADEDSVFAPENPEASEKLEEAGIVAVDENGNGYKNITAAIKSGAAKLYFKEGVDLGSVTHLDIDHSVTIFGNGAYISSGERDLAVDTYIALTDDITVTVYNLHGIAVWGQRQTGYKVNVNLYNCNDLGRVYLNGTTGENNVSLYNCTADNANLIGDTVVYSNANGKLVVDGCTFTNIGCPVNLNHKIAGEQTVVVTNSTFVNCSTEGTAAYYAPIRLYNSVAGANQTVTVAGNTFTYTEGKAPINNADVLLNAKHNGVDAAGTIKASVQVDAAVAAGVNVTRSYAVATADELEAFNKLLVKNALPRAGYTLDVLADIDYAGKTWTPVDSHQDFGAWVSEINGHGHTISNLTIKGQAMFTRFAGIGNVVIKDITFDKANVNSNGALNTSILTVQTYQNVLLDNVDVKNSTITGGYKVAPLMGSVYNESASSITATLKNCDVSDTIVTATLYDFFTCGMVSFVYTTDNDYIEYENCSITNVQLRAPNVYEYHANIHYTSADTDDQINEHPGVKVTNVTFENI